MKLFAILLVAAASGASAAGNIYVDAGSSGSKIVTYKDNDNTVPGTSVKVLSVCIAKPSHDPSALQGNSAFSIVDTNNDKCHKISTTIEKPPSKPANQPQTSKKYAEQIILPQAKAALADATNGHQIPALATAGNRIISKAQNNKIWGTGHNGFCGATDGAGYTIAPPGDKCGTIAGTREALFEATAWHATHSTTTPYLYTNDRRAIFTSGGASAQISIPLYTEADVAVFKRAVTAVRTDFAGAGCSGGKCTGIKTPKGEDLPYFTQDLADGPNRAAADFIRYWTKAEIKNIIHQEPDNAVRNLPFKHLTGNAKANSDGAAEEEFKGLGTISFIGLEGKGGPIYKGVAGGANQIEEWAKHRDCALGTWDKKKEAWTKNINKWSAEKFDGCFDKFKEDLDLDIIWKAAKDVIKGIDFKHYRVSFGTASIQPKGLVNLENKDPDNLVGAAVAKKSEKEVMDKALPQVKKAHQVIDNDFNLFGIGRGGAPMLPVPRSMLKKGLTAVKTVTKEMCMKLGRGFGFGWTNTCAKSLWMHQFLSLGIDQRNGQKPHEVDFGDADVGKGEPYGFKSKRNLRKREQQQSTLDVDVHAHAEMLALGKQILGRVSKNTLSYMHGATYSF